MQDFPIKASRSRPCVIHMFVWKTHAELFSLFVVFATLLGCVRESVDEVGVVAGRRLAAVLVCLSHLFC